MTTWRPQPVIRNVAIGLHWRDERLLAAEVRDDAGHLKGVRPLGGGIHFGERWHAALAREFKEELGVDILIRGEPLVIENIFVHQGAIGHEVVFIGEIEFVGNPLEGKQIIEFEEDTGAPGVARWYDLATLDLDDGPKLYPAGLKDLLRRGGRDVPGRA